MRRMRQLARRFGRAESGQSLVEFALVMPLMVGLLVAILELGQAWRASQVVTHATREGTRLAVVPTSNADSVTQRIQGVLRQQGLDPAQAQLSLALRSGTGTLDTVTVSYPVQFPLLGPVVTWMKPDATSTPPGTVQVRSTFVMRNE